MNSFQTFLTSVIVWVLLFPASLHAASMRGSLLHGNEVLVVAVGDGPLKKDTRYLFRFNSIRGQYFFSRLQFGYEILSGAAKITAEGGLDLLGLRYQWGADGDNDCLVQLGGGGV